MGLKDFFDRFPARKRSTRTGVLPELALIDLRKNPEYSPLKKEGPPDEAEFISLDDLFAMAEKNDDPAEEADFISLDELFNLAGDASSEAEAKRNAPLTGPVIFTLIPRHRYQFIDGTLSRVIRRCLMMTACEEGVKLLKTRIRPVFIQWQLELEDGMKAEQLVALFRLRLDEEIGAIHHLNNESYWSDNCLIQPGTEEMTINHMMRFINTYQEL